MITDSLAFLQSWYASCCDGEWEHGYGVEIETLDNPGWSVEIDLMDTPLSGTSLERLVIDRTEDDWVQFWSDGIHFKGACGPLNLGEMLKAFRDFVETVAMSPPV
ncbi:immunity 53 family protein [Streptosporangium sp. NPDC003464]